MKTTTESFSKDQLKTLPDIRPGDTVRVHQKITEGDKQRIQIFEGVVLARKHGKGINSTLTVKKISQGVGVERIFPLHSPNVERFEVTKRAKVRRAKLYYLKDAKGKKARLKAKEFGIEAPTEEPAPQEEVVVVEEAPLGQEVEPKQAAEEEE